MTLNTSLQDKQFVYWINEGRIFSVIHSTAISSLSLSIIGSIGSIIYSAYRLGDQPRNFYKWSISERLVIYLALIDLIYSVSDLCEHCYIIQHGSHPPEWLCTVFGYMVVQFITAQMLLTLFIAVNAFLMVVRQTKLRLGCFDYRLIIYTMCIPAIISVVHISTDALGWNGAWCLFKTKYRRTSGSLSGSMFVILITISILYVSIWWKLKASGPVPLTSSWKSNIQRQKYQRTARVMTCFIVVFIAQYWPYVIFSLIAWFDPERLGPNNIIMYILIVFFCNSGGFLNFLAYTYIRRYYLNQTNSGVSQTDETRTKLVRTVGTETEFPLQASAQL